MGRASSQKKVARAATTGGGRTVGAKRPMGWYSVMAAVVALGLFLVAFSRNQELSRGQAATLVAPKINKDHWHSSISVYVCDHFLPNIPLFESPDGIHTHGDGVIHIHPFTANAAGINATLGFFARAVKGMTLSIKDLKMPPIAGDTNLLDTKNWVNGAKCPNGQAGKVKFTVNGKAQTIDPAAWRLRNGDYLDVGFVPDNTPLPSNPSEKKNLANINDVSTSTGTTTPTTAAHTSTTAASVTTVAPGATVAPTTVAPTIVAPTTAAPTTVAPAATAAPGTTAPQSP